MVGVFVILGIPNCDIVTASILQIRELRLRDTNIILMNGKAKLQTQLSVSGAHPH